MVRDLKQEIENRARDLVERIREYSRSQKDLWRQVPLLALEAYGIIIPFSPYRYERAYRNGLWGIQSNEHFDSTFLEVDLETGELMALRFGELAESCDVIRLAYRMEGLNAQNIVAKLKEEAQQRSPKNEREREKLKQEFNLTKKYQRRK